MMDRLFKLSVGSFQSLSTITCQVLYEAAVELVSELLRHVGPKHSKGRKRIENKEDDVSLLEINQDRKEEIEEEEWRERRKEGKKQKRKAENYIILQKESWTAPDIWIFLEDHRGGAVCVEDRSGQCSVAVPRYTAQMTLYPPAFAPCIPTLSER
jgi:hypothetical protein